MIVCVDELMGLGVYAWFRWFMRLKVLPTERINLLNHQ